MSSSTYRNKLCITVCAEGGGELISVEDFNDVRMDTNNMKNTKQCTPGNYSFCNTLRWLNKIFTLVINTYQISQNLFPGFWIILLQCKPLKMPFLKHALHDAKNNIYSIAQDQFDSFCSRIEYTYTITGLTPSEEMFKFNPKTHRSIFQIYEIGRSHENLPGIYYEIRNQSSG